MPHYQSASLGVSSVITGSSIYEDSTRSLSVPFLALDADSHVLQERKSCNSLKLLHSEEATFPTPKSKRCILDNPGTHSPQTGDYDTFPFPDQFTPATISKSANGNGPKEGRPQKRKQISNPYLTPPTTPDRFIPCRRSTDETAKSFRLSKSPQDLTKNERLLRQNAASPDPFLARSPRRSGLVSSGHVQDHTRHLSRLQSGVRGSGDGLGLQRAFIGLQTRHTSAGSVWNMGSHNALERGPMNAVPDGRGGLLGSGTNAPIFTSQFFSLETEGESLDRFSGRLAAALDIDQTSRMLHMNQSPERGRSTSRRTTSARQNYPRCDSRTRWRDNQWISDFDVSLLDAPQLRDDFYCSVLAYDSTTHTLAVGLYNRIYLWSEKDGVQFPKREEDHRSTYVTSLSFSSAQGGHSILATGRNSGQISLWSLFDENDRFRSRQSYAISCLSFKPVTTRRQSGQLGREVSVEELLVGDEVGNVYYYCVEWISIDQIGSGKWHGSMHLMAKIDIHSQQICGLAWSPDGEYFATGANDNLCCLFDIKDILTPPLEQEKKIPSLGALIAGFGIPNFVPNAHSHYTIGSMLSPRRRNIHTDSIHHRMGNFRPLFVPGRQGMLYQISEGREKHMWIHSAAVKAIAFCPWQRGLIATGGGSNDRAIHFYHTTSGACLATISVQAQVTSLIWSTTRREIAATFGYAQPEHPYRIAVFSWPDCKQVVAIPMAGELRALYAIPYPGGPNETSRQNREGRRWWSRTAEEGCLIVVCSDESVKFHEVWCATSKSTSAKPGLLGGSTILEALEGIDKDNMEFIR